MFFIDYFENNGLNYYFKDFEHWDDVGLNVERPADLLTIYRHRSRSVCQAPIARTDDAETQTDETANDSDTSDLTMQLGASAEESCNNSHDVSLLPSSTKTEVKAVSVAIHGVRESPLTASSLPFNSTHPNMNAENSARLTMPISGTYFEPHQFPSSFSQPAHLQNSARALKEELQQGVEDVCQKLNSFFSNKPNSLSSNSRPGFTQVKTPDRSSFSLFNSK